MDLNALYKYDDTGLTGFAYRSMSKRGLYEQPGNIEPMERDVKQQNTWVQIYCSFADGKWWIFETQINIWSDNFVMIIIQPATVSPLWARTLAKRKKRNKA
jgi:hypothetical protein